MPADPETSASAAADAAAPSFRERWALVALTVGAIAFGFWRGVHFANAASGVGYADGYWTQFWLTGYQDGYVRRALLGSLFAAAVPAGTSVAVLSFVQLTISALLLAAGIAIVARLVRRTAEPRIALVCAALFGFSPVGAMLFETTGDPLQSAMLVWLAGVLSAARLGEGGRLALLVAVCLVAMLIHEAGTFFVLPHLLLTAPRIRQLPLARRTFLVACIVAIVAAAIGLLTSDSAGVPRYFLTNTRDHSAMLADTLATPGFAQVFRQEMHDSFGAPTAVLSWLARLLCFPVVPVAFIAFLATFARQRIRLAPLFVIWIACCVPLFVIAHDWGRFGVLTLLLVLATMLADEGRLLLGRAGSLAQQGWDALLDRLIRSPGDAWVVRATLAVVILSSTAIWTDYRVVGGRMSLFLSVLALLVALAVFVRRGRSSPAA